MSADNRSALRHVRRLARTRLKAWRFAIEWAWQETLDKCVRKTTRQRFVFDALLSITITFDGWGAGHAHFVFVERRPIHNASVVPTTLSYTLTSGRRRSRPWQSPNYDILEAVARRAALIEALENVRGGMR